MSITGKAKKDLFPMLFIGHGSPMNAIEENEFVHTWSAIAANIPKPDAIVSISAHWETKGSFVTAMENPRTIHDFGGFPKALYEVQYPAPGNPALANQVIEDLLPFNIEEDLAWGLDHGCWSVLKRMYPGADIPVLQLSLDYTQKPHFHYQLAQGLLNLRKQGILIMGSGNLVHNLGLLTWHNPYGAFEWATEAYEGIKEMILSNDIDKLLNYNVLSKAYQLAIPTPEHFLPLLYILALKQGSEKINFFSEKIVMGSISMASLLIG